MDKGDDDGKSEVRNWIGRCLADLKTQIDQFESEIETFPVRKRNTPRVEQLTEAIARFESYFHSTDTRDI